MLIRWCLHLKMLSTTEALSMTVGATMWSYIQRLHPLAGFGIQPEVTQLQQLMETVNMETLEKHLSILYDEMRIRLLWRFRQR